MPTRIALTMGDISGIGPEVLARAWSDPRLHALSLPFVIGDPTIMNRALSLVSPAQTIQLQLIHSPEEAQPSLTTLPCLPPPTPTYGDLSSVPPGVVDPRAGRAAYEFLVTAIDLALDRRIDAMTTLPLNKNALHLSGVPHPGHTEILAEHCGAPNHAMMLYLETDSDDEARSDQSSRHAPTRAPGLGVIHVTLHVALRNVFDLLTIPSIASKIRLADQAMRPLTNGRAPRIAVTALNPHAGEDGLFGNEEQTIIRPAVELVRHEGVNVDGPFPNDTLFYHALQGQYDAVVAMYHDQGHIALKTVGFQRAVNVTLGLPIVRTSVAHGTAFDIAWRGVADPSSLISAVRVAAQLVVGGKP